MNRIFLGNAGMWEFGMAFAVFRDDNLFECHRLAFDSRRPFSRPSVMH